MDTLTEIVCFRGPADVDDASAGLGTGCLAPPRAHRGRCYRIGFPLRMNASEYSESEVCSTTQTVMRALPVPHELSRATGSEVRRGILRGSDVLTLQPRTDRFSERVHAEGLLHGVVRGACGCLGQGTARLLPAIRH